jgi:hypothetical protein
LPAIVRCYLKKRLPATVAAQVDMVIKSGSAADALGGQFGGKK